MRISTSQIQTVGINSILDQQAKLSRLQAQVASGQRIALPSDDPVGTSQMMSLQQTLDTTAQYKSNADAATNRLNMEDNTLQELTNTLQRARELTIEGKNATQTDESRGDIAAEVRQLLNQFVGLANTKDPNGDYLFSGGQAGTQPFAASGAGYAYFGDQNQRMVQIAAGHQIADSDPGSAVFQLVRNGNGTFVTSSSATNTGTGMIDPGSVSGSYTPTLVNGVDGLTLEFVQVLPTDPVTYNVYATGDATHTPIATGTYTSGQAITVNGANVIVSGTPANGDTFQIQSSQYQDIFTTLQNLATALQTPIAATGAGNAQLQNTLNRCLTDLDQGMANLSTVQSNVGARLNTIASQQNISDDESLQTQQVLGSIKDLDYASAIGQLNQQLTGLQAAQQAYIKVNGLSLFNFLK